MCGIDYGRGLVNIDQATGIRYGVISQNEVVQAWADSAEPEYLDCETECERCGGLCEEDGEECTLCGGRGSVLETSDMIDNWMFASRETHACSSEDGDIFITKSPYYTKCRFASPCAPGAGCLMSPDEGGVKAYCFEHSWFENGAAPYTVYRVSDDSIVDPKDKDIS